MIRLPFLSYILFILFFLSAQVIAEENSEENYIIVNAIIKNKTAYHKDSDDKAERSQNDNSLLIKFSQSGDTWSWFSKSRVQRLEGTNSSKSEVRGVRELQVNLDYENLSYKFGRQQIVWGKTDGIRLLDVINPLDLHEFILSDYSESRIPVWSFDTEIFFGDNSFEFLFVPEITSDLLPEPGDEFYIAPKVPAGIPFVVHDTIIPDNSSDNWEWGFKWSGRLGSMEYTLNAFHGWNNTPVPFRRLSAGPLLEISPRLTREWLYGGSADLPIGPTILRLELLYTPDRYRKIETPDQVGDFIKQKTARIALGLDWIKDNWLISPQLFYEDILDPDPRLSEDPSLAYATLLVQRKFIQDKLELRLFYLRGLNNEDSWISPKISYRFFDTLTVQLGADLISGETDGIFGQFRDRDRITIETTWYFL